MKELSYTLGLDIGIASIGWAVIENGADCEPIRIERLGVRIFPQAENPKNGASLAAPRRQARSARRVIRRRRHRKERIKNLIDRAGIMSVQDINRLFENSGFEKSVYELRFDALNRELEEKEVVRLLIHYAQRRGYKSNSKSQETGNRDDGKVKAAISENQSRMERGGYRTIGEMLWRDPDFRTIQEDGRELLLVRNKQDNYKMTVSRDMLQKEIQEVFRSQRKFGATWATQDFEKQYLNIWGSQRNFDEGPGGNSPFSGAQIEKMLGTCTFEKGEPRAPKACYSAEYFRLLQTVNNIKVYSFGNDAVPLSEEQRATVVQLAKTSPIVTYATIRKELCIPEDCYFNSLQYGRQDRDAVEKKAKLNEMQFYHQLRICLNKYRKGYIDNLDVDTLDEIGRIVTLYKSDDNRRKSLARLDLPDQVIELILGLSASKAAHLSLKAMRKILPYLEEGLTYDKACTEVYGGHDGKNEGVVRSRKLHLSDVEEINNPVVRRAVSQSIKVINAVVREYGSPEIVRIELARELGKNFDVRMDIKKRQDENAARNARIRERVKEFKKTGNPTGLDIVKLRLFEDQDGVCLYSGKNLDISRLFDPGYVDVDHIIPYSISFDDSYSNKVLVLSSENRQKGNRLPYEYFGHDKDRWARFEALVETKVSSYKKKKNLLTENLSEGQIEGFKQRNLEDTQYLSRVVYQLVNDHLLFAEGSGRYHKRTQTVNGAITAEIRKRLGIEKIRSDGDLHHACDAAVIACVSPGMIQKITNYSKWSECIRETAGGFLNMETGEVLTKEEFDALYSPKFPEPWSGFRHELEARLSDHPQNEIDQLHLTTYDEVDEIQNVFVSRMSRHKVSGPAHAETIRSGKKKGCTIVKTSLTDLKLDKKTGEIVGYYNPSSDVLLYEALKDQLIANGGDAKKAFKEPFYKPKADGGKGPLVRKVKIETAASLSVDTGRGLADNSRMLRVDVYHVDGDGYYFVPIYVADTLKGNLPNRAVVAFNPIDEWKEMYDKNFVFSLYQNDLIHIEKKKGFKVSLNKAAREKSSTPKELNITEGYFYFDGLSISTGAIKISTHDRRYEQPSLGGKSLDLLEKMEVDILGEIHGISLPEARQQFDEMRHK